MNLDNLKKRFKELLDNFLKEDIKLYFLYVLLIITIFCFFFVFLNISKIFLLDDEFKQYVIETKQIYEKASEVTKEANLIREVMIIDEYKRLVDFSYLDYNEVSFLKVNSTKSFLSISINEDLNKFENYYYVKKDNLFYKKNMVVVFEDLNFKTKIGLITRKNEDGNFLISSFDLEDEIEIENHKIKGIVIYIDDVNIKNE